LPDAGDAVTGRIQVIDVDVDDVSHGPVTSGAPVIRP
jgi:hypothetical protein